MRALAFVVSGRSSANSSPPIRNTLSAGRMPRRSSTPTSRSASSPATCPRVSLSSLKSSMSASTSAKPAGRAADEAAHRLVEAAVVGEARERVRGRLELLALERAQALERDRGVRDEQRRVVDDLGRQRRAAAVAGEVAVRPGRRAQRQAQAAALEVDAPLVAAGLRQRHQRRAVERVLARALVAQPGLREHELALDDLADLHAGEPERAPDRARDDAQHGAVLARLGEPREGLPEPAPAGRLARLGRLAAERVAEHRRGAPQRSACASPSGPATSSAADAVSPSGSTNAEASTRARRSTIQLWPRCAHSASPPSRGTHTATGTARRRCRSAQVMSQSSAGVR